MKHFLTGFLIIITGCLGVASAETVLATDGRALHDIIISPKADEQVTAAAHELADYLRRICGATFTVREGDGSEGIVVGLPQDFTKLPFEPRFGRGGGIHYTDKYELKSLQHGLYLLGSTPLAVEFAVWDLLYRFGHRQFFPTETWEVIPHNPKPTIEIDWLEQPDYITRDAPRGGLRQNLRGKAFQEAWRQWRVRNRMLSSFKLNTGHSYLGLIKRNQAAFDAHPEFYALVDGERRYRGGSTKICIGNEQLRELVVADVIARIEADPSLDSISLDPSDGGNWCECEKCMALGTISDRVVALSNQVARVLEERYEKTYYIGIYAYNDYSPAPNIELHPTVIPSLATAFIRGGQSFQDMLDGWDAKAEMLGIREYYGVPVWNSAMPGAARAASPVELAKAIRAHYDAGARFVNAESDDAWGSNGLGYYVASRFLWDVESFPVRFENPASQAQAIIDDFLTKAFGKASEPMREFYTLITSKPLHSDHMMAVMYGSLDQARRLTDVPRVLARLDELVLYTRFVDLQRQWEGAPDSRKQETFDRLASFIWRARDCATIDLTGTSYYLNRQQRQTELYGWVPGSREQHAVPPERLREGGDKPFTKAEIDGFLADGMARHERLAFEQKGFSDELVPAAKRLGLREVETVLPPERRSRGKRVYYTWVAKAPHTFKFQFVNGLIEHYRDRGDATFELRTLKEPAGKAIATVNVPPDGVSREIDMPTAYDGLHELHLSDGMDSSSLTWPPGTPMTLKLDFSTHFDYDEQVLYFYVPKGTAILGGYAQGSTGQLIAPNGEAAVQLGDCHGYFHAPVPEGQDGKLWTFKGSVYKGRFMLMTVPPYLARNAGELLLPREVVDADAP